MNSESLSRSIAVVGWHGHRNAGDDAMLLGLARHLPSIRELHVLASGDALAQSCKDAPRLVGAVPRLPGPLGIKCGRRRLARVGDLVLGGGSILHSSNSIEWKLRMVREARRRGRRTFALGVSLGPFPDAAAPRRCAELLALLDAVMVRDERSEALALELCPTARVALAPDLSLAISDLARPGREPPVGRRLGVALTTTGMESAEVMRLLEALGDGIPKLLAEHDLAGVDLLSFCSDPRFGDHAVHERLAALLPGCDVRHRPYRGDAVGLLEAVAGCALFVGMRLHSQLFAAMASVPLVAVSYHPKNEAVLSVLHSDMVHAPARTLDSGVLLERAREPFVLPESRIAAAATRLRTVVAEALAVGGPGA